MTSFVVLFAAVWIALTAIFVALILAHDARQERRSRRAQHIAPWVNAPDAAHLHLVGDEPRDAQILDFPGTHQSGVGAR